MKFAALLVVAALTGAGAGSFAYKAGRAAATPCVAPAAASAPLSPGAWRASNGVVLTADDIARLDAQNRDADRHAAELEYSLSKIGSSKRVRPGPVPSRKTDAVPVKP